MIADENTGPSLEEQLDMLTEELVRTSRRTMALLMPIGGAAFDPGSAPARRAEIEALCNEAEMWVRSRLPLQSGETSAATRLAHWAQKEERALKQLISEIVLARQAARGLPPTPESSSSASYPCDE